jgi:hypothetical protein
MRAFNGRFPKRPWMALLTAEAVSRNCPMRWADHRDTHALYHSESGRFVGLNIDGELLLGQEGIRMVDGVWILQEDPEMLKKYLNLNPLNLMLQIIG